MADVTEQIVALGSGDARFEQFVKAWDERVAQSQEKEFDTKFLHGTVEKLRLCAEKGVRAARGVLEEIEGPEY
jgi:hypothetical protein